MSLKIANARKKKNPRMKLKSALPVPMIPDVDSEDETPSLAFTLFSGHFKYGVVTIQQVDHATTLWQNGFFGDGSLSNTGLKYKTNFEKMDVCQIRRIQDWREKFSEQGENMKPKNFDHLSEALHLCFEESMFLSYALGTLVLTNDERKEMDIDDMWTSFCELNARFPLQYAVYHHFRCKGWVVKSGIKFGADWMLYPVGPPFYHSQYLVWVQCLWEDSLEEDSTLSGRSNDIKDVSALERLSGHVGKSILLCQVLRPRDLTDTDLKSIECLRKFTISEVLLQRWTTTSEPPKPSPSTKSPSVTSTKSPSVKQKGGKRPNRSSDP